MHKFMVVMLAISLSVLALPVNAQQPQPTPDPSGAESGSPVVAPELFVNGSQAFQAGEFQQALLDYSLFLWLNPTDSQGFLARGLTKHYLGETEAALADLDQALSFAPLQTEYTARAYLTRADVFLQQNNVESALSDLNASLEIMPDLAEALNTRAAILVYQREFDEALADYSDLIALQPDAPSVYNQRGELNRQLGNVDAALADFNQALLLDPNNIDAYFSRAALYSAQSDYEAALADLDTILSLDPQEASIYLLRGQINASAAQPEASAADYLSWIERISTRTISPGEAAPLNQPFVIEMGAGWVYYMEFEAQADQVLNIEAVRLEDSEADPLVVLVGSAQEPLIADDDSGGDYNALIQNYVIPTEGQYTVLVSHASGGTDGRVGIRIRLDD